MQGQKHVLVVDNDVTRRDQIATVLSFVGEHFHVCPEDDVNQYFNETENILTVILCGEVSELLVEFVKKLFMSEIYRIRLIYQLLVFQLIFVVVD